MRQFSIQSPVFELDPLIDARWQKFIEREKQSGIFHSIEWLKALRDSFGYEPVVLTLSEPAAELQSGIPFCRIRSRLTGNRLVSLPFSDHCEPLGDQAELGELLQNLSGATLSGGMQYVEIRPTRPPQTRAFKSAESFFLHRLDLTPSIDQIFQSLQKSSIRRSIQRAERLDIKLEQGRSEWHLQTFYKLFVLTRRRLQAPPHPIQWFRNLIAYLGPKINILVAVKDDRPIASIIVLDHKQTVTYKYGCSDASRHSLGGMPFLLWKAIEAAKLSGALEFDFGRTDIENEGLTIFKDRWGAKRTTLTYFRYGKQSNRHWSGLPGAKIIKRSFAHLPQSLLIRVGNIVYRHIG